MEKIRDKMEKKKGLFNSLKSLDDVLILFGMLSNLGIIIVSMIVINILQGFTKIDVNYLSQLITPLHILLSIGIYFVIGKSKSFKIGYITGFIVGVIWLMKYSLGIIN